MLFQKGRKGAVAVAFLLLSFANALRRETPRRRSLVRPVGLSTCRRHTCSPMGEIAATVSSIGSLTERYNLTFRRCPGWKRASAMPASTGSRGRSFRPHLSFKAASFRRAAPSSPNVAIGFQDILGTVHLGGGTTSSRRVFGNVELTLGLGWALRHRGNSAIRSRCSASRSDASVDTRFCKHRDRSASTSFSTARTPLLSAVSSGTGLSRCFGHRRIQR